MSSLSSEHPRPTTPDLPPTVNIPVQDAGGSDTPGPETIDLREGHEAEVIDLHDAQARAAMRADAGILLDQGELQDALQRLGANAQRIASENVQGLSATAFDGQLLKDGDLDSRLVEAEIKGVLAKAGLKPEGTIEHLQAFRELLVAAYRDTHLVDPETRLRVLQLDLDIQKIETSRSTVVLAHCHAEEIKLLQAKTAIAVEEAKSGATVATAKADSHVETVRAVGKTRSADIDIDLMNDVKRTEAIKKKLANQRDRERTIWREAVKPRIRVASIPIGPLIVAANLVADGPGQQDTFLLGAIDAAWDGLYMPLRDGLIRSVVEMFGRIST